ncbi:MAG: hypothetical protein JWN44_5598 [Myxococcales bacterium]|nr:hypothetical protein [Myxococcales bacterium]
MTLDVSWDGVVLAKSAQAREQDGGWFVELEQPMPVGTKLQLSGDTQATVLVARVHEGIGSGMLVKKADEKTASVTPTAAAAPAPAISVATTTTTPAAAAAAAEGDESGKDESAKDENGAKKERRKKGRAKS